MLRYTLCLGDEPETGGYIEPLITTTPSKIMGHPVAFIGGKAFCNACRTFGVIAKAGGPYRNTNCGREIALDGDILRCQCMKLPRMIATKQSIARCEDRGAATGLDTTPEFFGDARMSRENSAYSRLIVLQDEGGNPISNQRYRISVEKGQAYEGITNEAGETAYVYADFSAEFEIELMV